MQKTITIITILSIGLLNTSNVFANEKLKLKSKRFETKSQTLNTQHIKRSGPDLVPEPHYPNGAFEGAPNAKFCKNSGQVLVKLKNNGEEDAGPFTLKVIFHDAIPVHKTVTKSYPALPASPSAIPFLTNIPLSAFSGNEAKYTIIIDSQKQVKETNEKNNTVKSKCLKPAT